MYFTKFTELVEKTRLHKNILLDSKIESIPALKSYSTVRTDTVPGLEVYSKGSRKDPILASSELCRELLPEKFQDINFLPPFFKEDELTLEEYEIFKKDSRATLEDKGIIRVPFSVIDYWAFYGQECSAEELREINYYKLLKVKDYLNTKLSFDEEHASSSKETIYKNPLVEKEEDTITRILVRVIYPEIAPQVLAKDDKTVVELINALKPLGKLDKNTVWNIAYQMLMLKQKSVLTSVKPDNNSYDLVYLMADPCIRLTSVVNPGTIEQDKDVESFDKALSFLTSVAMETLEPKVSLKRLLETSSFKGEVVSQKLRRVAVTNNSFIPKKILKYPTKGPVLGTEKLQMTLVSRTGTIEPTYQYIATVRAIDNTKDVIIQKGFYGDLLYKGVYFGDIPISFNLKYKVNKELPNTILFLEIDSKSEYTSNNIRRFLIEILSYTKSVKEAVNDVTSVGLLKDFSYVRYLKQRIKENKSEKTNILFAFGPLELRAGKGIIPTCDEYSSCVPVLSRITYGIVEEPSEMEEHIEVADDLSLVIEDKDDKGEMVIETAKHLNIKRPLGLYLSEQVSSDPIYGAIKHLIETVLWYDRKIVKAYFCEMPKPAWGNLPTRDIVGIQMGKIHEILSTSDILYSTRECASAALSNMKGFSMIKIDMILNAIVIFSCPDPLDYEPMQCKDIHYFFKNKKLSVSNYQTSLIVKDGDTYSVNGEIVNPILPDRIEELYMFVGFGNLENLILPIEEVILRKPECASIVISGRVYNLSLKSPMTKTDVMEMDKCISNPEILTGAYYAENPIDKDLEYEGEITDSDMSSDSSESCD